MTLSLRPHPAGRGHAADFAIALTEDSFNPRGLREGPGPGGPGGPGGPPPPPGGFGIWDF